MRVRLAAFVAATLVACVSLTASAEPMDPALERLTIDPSTGAPSADCHPGGAWNDKRLDPATMGSVACTPDHVAFKKLISQYAFAFAPTAMHSARTMRVSPDLSLRSA